MWKQAVLHVVGEQTVRLRDTRPFVHAPVHTQEIPLFHVDHLHQRIFAGPIHVDQMPSVSQAQITELEKIDLCAFVRRVIEAME